jgi:hypothetical protein
MRTQRKLTQTCKSVATANSGLEDKHVRKARKKIEATQVEELAFIGSAIRDGDIFQDTLYRRFHKAIKRGIVCRTIFLRRQWFDLAMKGNAAALKWFWETSLGQTNEQLKRLAAS